MRSNAASPQQANGSALEARASIAPEGNISLDDPRVLQAMEDYLKLLQAGEQPDRAAFLGRYPEVAKALAVCLQGLDFVHAAGAELSHPPATADEAAEPPEYLGDFRILREVGRGGMGVVYEAEQVSLGRRVALKVLPLAATMDPRHLQRFQNEARAVASLHHEHIVPVYAVGCERGVHFYAMQFIDGQTLAEQIQKLREQTVRDATTSHARPSASAAVPTDEQTAPYAPSPTLPLADTASGAQAARSQPVSDAGFFRRVAEWGVQAAEALEYAHSVGVVHRDIKPGNLMADSQGKLWVTDFGLARTSADTNLTITGDVLGTLRYMSPEQALAKHGLVDHHTDIYSLGVTLYELLTLQPAVAGSDRREILHNIAFTDSVAPRSLNRKMPQDLETIVLKASAKEAGERYASARELADDLRHFLAHEPIRAKKPSMLQRASKWSRRHPTVVRAAVLVAFLVTAGSLLSTWLIRRALDAEVAARQRADEQKTIAEERAEETATVLQFVEQRMFAAPRPDRDAGGLGREVTLRQALEASLPYVGTSLGKKPLIEARLRRTLGLSFHHLGQNHVAAEQFERARALYTKCRGADDPDTLAAVNNLATSYDALGRHSDAVRLREKTLVLRRARFGTDHPDTLASMSNLANSYDAVGRHADALALREETLERRRATLGPDHRDTLASMNNLAISYTALGRHAEALKLREETLAVVSHKFGPDNPRTLAAMHNLAQTYQVFGRHSDALALYEQTLSLAKSKLGPKHPKTLLVMNNLAWLLATAADPAFRNPARAVQLATEVTKLLPRNADFWGTLGTAHYRVGAWQQASVELERSISLRRPDDAANVNESLFLAMARWQLGDQAGARNWFAKGDACMAGGQFRDDESRRFRAEAAALLKISDKCKGTQSQPAR